MNKTQLLFSSLQTLPQTGHLNDITGAQTPNLGILDSSFSPPSEEDLPWSSWSFSCRALHLHRSLAGNLIFCSDFNFSYRGPSDCVHFRSHKTWICLCTLRPDVFSKEYYLNLTTSDMISVDPSQHLRWPRVLQWLPNAHTAFSLLSYSLFPI